MSADATAWTFRHSPLRGAGFQVHLAIADSVSDVHDNLFWMARANLATKARVSPETVTSAVGALADGGMIEPVDEGMDAPEARQRAGRPTRWRFLFPDLPVVFEARRSARGVSTEAIPPSGVSPQGVLAESTRNPTRTQTTTQASSGSEAKASKPRRSDPRAEPLTRTWWEAQDPRPAQSFVAARGVVSGALAAGWSEDELRAVLARTDPPLSGGRLDYVRSRMRGSRRAEDQPMDRDLPEGRVAL